jgi:hypothetical protein
MGGCKGVKGCACKGKSIKEHFDHFEPILRAYERAGRREREQLLKNVPFCFVQLMAETGLNILKGNLKLPKSQYAHLRPHKRLLLSLSKHGISLKKKKELLVKKKGGFLPVLAPILLSALSGLAGQALGKIIV